MHFKHDVCAYLSMALCFRTKQVFYFSNTILSTLESIQQAAWCQDIVLQQTMTALLHWFEAGSWTWNTRTILLFPTTMVIGTPQHCGYLDRSAIVVSFAFQFNYAHVVL